MTTELGICKAKICNYNLGNHHIEAAYEGIIKQLAVAHGGNRILGDETREFLDQNKYRRHLIQELNNRRRRLKE